MIESCRLVPGESILDWVNIVTFRNILLYIAGSLLVYVWCRLNQKQQHGWNRLTVTNKIALSGTSLLFVAALIGGVVLF